MSNWQQRKDRVILDTLGIQQEHSQHAAGQDIGAGLVLGRGDCITISDQAESMKAMAMSGLKGKPPP